MSDYLPGGRRRLDRVLDPAKVADLGSGDVEDLQAMRADAMQEEAELSYVRRLLQGRLDQVRDELSRRAASPGEGHPATVRSDSELVEMLSGILAERRPASGSGRYVDAEADLAVQRRREPEVAANDVRLSDPSSLDDHELSAASRRLEALEADVSSLRQRVQAVADTIGGELLRRSGVDSPI